MFRKIITTTLVAVSVAVASTAPAFAAVVRRDFDISDPRGTGTDFLGRTNTYDTNVRITGTLRADRTLIVAWSCVSPSISGCNLVANQKKLGESDDRRGQATSSVRIDKTFNRASGQNPYVRACFTRSDGVASCSSWTAGTVA
ncbi:hypothetical protein PWY87_31900 [Kribbella solani]|uniref:hypothetical protein n=1 Tax=Kribbella solani TaxID=236067 RepID=UPI0029BE1136|nr:hypothetical protein [Kribbella solani]MDX2969211.1 hypothetical protein [Kribbella solani]MDX3006324.1 hypothetical protein [Kribbella solani]